MRSRLGRGPLLMAVLLVLASPVSAQRADRIPSHPDQLRFRPRSIDIPRAEGFEHRLSTGTRVVLVEDHTLPLVEVTVALRAGSFLDPLDKPGLAELTGALIRRGGTLRRSADEIDQAIDFLGAEIDTSGGTARSGASLSALSETLDEAMAIFFELLSQPGFQPDRVDSVRTSLLASLEARNDNPIDIMEREWEFLIFGERHFRARRMTATEVTAFRRQELAAFHRRYWRPQRAVIAVSGAIETEAALEMLERHVATWAAAVAPGPVDDLPWPPPAREASPPGVFLVDHPTPQAKVSLGHDLPRLRDWDARDGVALQVMNEILGGTSGLISRINGRLRGREGLVYRALSEADTDPEQQGIFRIFLDAAPENVVRSLEICLEEIDRMRASPVSEQALSVVREEFLSRLQLRFDSAERIAGYFAEDLLLGRSHAYWYDYARRLHSITPANVQQAARRYLRPGELTLLIVGESTTVRAAPTSNRRLAKLLAAATDLPTRNPLTLEPRTATPNESRR